MLPSEAPNDKAARFMLEKLFTFDKQKMRKSGWHRFLVF
jgi:hypothetical protein